MQARPRHSGGGSGVSPGYKEAVAFLKGPGGSGRRGDFSTSAWAAEGFPEDSGLWLDVSGAPGQGYNVDLLEHEWQGGHTIKLHVAKTAAFLVGRIKSGRNTFSASSFNSLRQATGLINKTLNAGAADIQKMMNSPNSARVIFRATFFKPTGYTVRYGSNTVKPTYNVLVVIEKPATTTLGFLIVTAYPY